MKITLLTFATLAGGLLVMPGSADAHHGWGEFDATAEVTVEGVVTDFHYVNPHCVVEFDVNDATGHVRKWQGEFSNPGVLSRKGWTAASLQPGDRITISGHPARNNVPALHVTRIRMSRSGELKLELQE